MRPPLPATHPASLPSPQLRRSRHLAAAPCLALVLAAASAAAAEVVNRRVLAMGTMLDVTVTAPTRAAAVAASERAIVAVAVVEQRLSTWRENSELATLNAAPANRPLPLSAELAADLAAAARWWRATAGAFDPGLGTLVAAWGLRSGGRRLSDQELAAARAGSGMRHLELNGTVAVRRRPDVVIDEGGFGKGVALDAALRAVGGCCRAVIDFGGQVALSDGRPLQVSVGDPERRHEAAVTCALERGSIATSGASERSIVVDGVRVNHILDPRSGAPAPDFGSLTVWAASATAADCLSTGLYVMGPERALEWAEREGEIGVLVLDRIAGRLRARVSSRWPGEVIPTREGVVVERCYGRRVQPAGEESRAPGDRRAGGRQA